MNDILPAVVGAWAARSLPARLTATETAKLLGFPEHDIQILMAARKLIPLGEPAPNAPKYFSAIEVIQFAADKDWLNRATKDVARYWKRKRERRRSGPPSLAIHSEESAA
jgi:hypothetical protein